MKTVPTASSAVQSRQTNGVLDWRLEACFTQKYNHPSVVPVVDKGCAATGVPVSYLPLTLQALKTGSGGLTSGDPAGASCISTDLSLALCT